MTLPYDPRRFPCSNRYLAAGRLCPLPYVVLAKQFWQLPRRVATRRPEVKKATGPASPERRFTMDIGGGVEETTYAISARIAFCRT